MFGLSYPSKLRKAEIVENFNHFLTTRTESWLKMLHVSELMTLKILSSNKNEPFPEPKFKMERGIFVKDYDFENEYDYICLPDEIYANVQKLIDSELKDRIKSSPVNNAEKIMTGVLNLHGQLFNIDFIQLAAKVLEEEALIANDGKDTEFSLFKDLEVITTRFKPLADPEGYFTSPYMDFVVTEANDFSIEIDERRNIPSFDAEQIIRAADMPFPQIITKGYDEVRKIIEKQYSKADPALVDCFMTNIWLHKQIGAPTVVSDIMDELNLKFRSEAEVSKFFNKLAVYLNNLPMWKFEGLSSVQISVSGTPSIPSLDNISLGPNLRAQGFTSAKDFFEKQEIDPLEIFQSRFDNAAPSAPFGRKVGRNEPCPCGSGRKYKHCCGKGL